MTISSRSWSWTDDELVLAVTESTSYRGVLRRLGLKNGNHRHVQQRIEKLGIDTSHFEHHPQKRLCSDDQLRRAVAKARSFSDVLRALGVELTTVNFHRLRRRIGILGVDTLHFRRARSEHGRKRSWTDDDLRAAVVRSFGYAETIRMLGLIPAGGNYVQVQRRMRELELDTSHFRGQGWNVEGKFIKRIARPLEDVLVAGRWTGSHALKRRLIRKGLKTAACELCGWAEQTPDGRVPIELDHLNGDKSDNRIENLRILCPNCHALQPTHRARNKKTFRARSGT